MAGFTPGRRGKPQMIASVRNVIILIMLVFFKFYEIGAYLSGSAGQAASTKLGKLCVRRSAAC